MAALAAKSSTAYVEKDGDVDAKRALKAVTAQDDQGNVREKIMSAGQSKRIWGELYKVRFSFHMYYDWIIHLLSFYDFFINNNVCYVGRSSIAPTSSSKFLMCVTRLGHDQSVWRTT